MREGKTTKAPIDAFQKIPKRGGRGTEKKKGIDKGTSDGLKGGACYFSLSSGLYAPKEEIGRARVCGGTSRTGSSPLDH